MLDKKNPDNQKDIISIIMPCFNAEHYLRETINCVLSQTYTNFEMLIVDDGSIDSSRLILSELSKSDHRLNLFHQQNCGPYPARNLALQHAKGDFIAFLDADDYWAPNCLEKLYHALIEAKADLSYCGWQNIVENGEDGLPYVPPRYENGDMFESFLKGCPWPIHAALTRKNIVDKVGGFSTRCFSAMDYDFWIRISVITQNIVRVPEVLAFYRWHHHGQISSTKWKQVLNSWRVRKDFVTQNPQLVAHIPSEKKTELIDGYLIKQAYSAFWKRDLISAQQLFRNIWQFGIWRVKDLPHIAASFLPFSLFARIVNLIS